MVEIMMPELFTNIIEMLNESTMTRAELQDALNIEHEIWIPWTTLYDYLCRLEKKGLVRRKQTTSGRTYKWCIYHRLKTCDTWNHACYSCKTFVLAPNAPPMKLKRGRPFVTWEVV